ncbi:MAG: hypothetical protein LC104_01025 [Bacteroidales bacterium]|nr:hypothetical protein [Bacteroidales bacterium]
MGLFDWLEGAAAIDSDSKFSEDFENLFPGAYTVTFGSSLSAIMPIGQTAHVYGDSIQYTVDWEGIIVDGFLSKIPGVHHILESLGGGIASSLVMGASGYLNFVYGQNVGAVYGITTNIQRGPSTSITGKSWLFGGSAPSPGKTLFAPPAPANAASKQANIDSVVDVITTILSGIMILAGLVADVLAGTVYKTNDSEDDPHKQVNNILKFGSSTITNRIMGLIIVAEKCGENLRNSVYRVPSMEDQLAIAKSDLASLEATISANKTDLEKRLKQAEDDALDAEKFLSAAIDQLIQMVNGAESATQSAQDTANSALTAANRTFLEIGDYEIAADGQIAFRANNSVLMEATEDGGSVTVDADTVASMRSGATKLILQGKETAEAVLTSGDTGTTRLRAGILDVGSDLQLMPEETTLQVGEPELGALLQMTPESISLSVGVPGEGASLTMTPESITLKVAAFSWTLSLDGITEEVGEVTREVTLEGHNMTAAETVFNVGVQGVTSESPTHESEVEASSARNQTILEETSDATANVNSAIIITD